LLSFSLEPLALGARGFGARSFGAGGFGAVAATAVLIFVGTLIARGRQPRGGADASGYNSAAFRRAGKSVGLNPAQVDTLENIVRVTKVKQPFLVFTSAGLLDDTLKKGLYSIDAARDLSNEERELLRRFAVQHPFTTLNAYASRLGWLDVPGRPLSMVIDRNGVVRECIIGARTYAELRDKVERYLDARS